MITIDPKALSVPEVHKYMLGTIAPRPIAFVSTVDREGNVNLSPYSFFNAFSTNPPTIVFSPSLRGRDGSKKHTLENILEHQEIVVNIVDYSMVQQMSLSSTEYDKGVNEFIKAGFTEQASLKVKPPRVAESPAQFECIVKDIIHLGTGGGAGNMVIAEVVQAHFQDHIFETDGRINPHKLDAVGRLGDNWYCRVNGTSLFEVEKPLRTKGIGVDQIPEQIRLSEVLSGNDLGILGNVESLPNEVEIKQASKSIEVKRILSNEKASEVKTALHKLAKKKLVENKTKEAWAILLQAQLTD